MKACRVDVVIEGLSDTPIAFDIDHSDRVNDLISRILGDYALPTSNWFTPLRYLLIYRGHSLRPGVRLYDEIAFDREVPILTLMAVPECPNCGE